MDTVVTMTNNGVIALPKWLTDTLALNGSEQFQVELTPQGILLRPVVAMPIEEYSEDRVMEFAAVEEEELRSKMN